jgi:deoxycytidylate deaminase/dephospho-CoA kinase
VTDVLNALNSLYEETSNFIVLGLTGRTGSGCSTAAHLLTNTLPNAPELSKTYSSGNDRRKYSIIRNFIVKNWKPFILIQVSTIITSIILELDFENFVKFVAYTLGEDVDSIRTKFKPFQESFDNMHQMITNYQSLPEKTLDEQEQRKGEAWNIYFQKLPNFCKEFKSAFQEYLGVNSYTLIYQKAGDNIRASGKANFSEFNANKIFTLPRKINKLIKVIRSRENKNCFIVIDAIRNPFEATYFHQRYAGFYLISINTPSSERINHLRKTHKLSDQQIIALDDKEYPKKLKGKDIYISQNIQKCIENADIHINNPDRQEFNSNELYSQLCWYVALILHPGLVTPTSIERCMQLAFSAKLNSGCISRQVGAVVTDTNFSVKAVGWNNTPEGQVPCLLRSAEELLNGGEEGVYSSYERSNEKFRKVLDETYSNIGKLELLSGRNLSYCFKDLQNEVEGEKNQVHTRSLHAEENAFLQLAKYGGEPIKGGTLFSTASPCEICSKKAYQLGIKSIVYVDPYPGISKEHILDAGTNTPEIILFRGALGRAYHRLYQSAMAYKDELQMLTGYSIKGGEKHDKKEEKIRALEVEILELKSKLKTLEGKQEK